MRCIDFQLLDCWFNNWRNLIWTAYFRRLRCGQLPTYLTWVNLYKMIFAFQKREFITLLIARKIFSSRHLEPSVYLC